MKEGKGNKKLLLYYTLEYLVIVLAVLGILKSRSFIIGADGFNQYYPVVVYAGKYIRGVLSGFMQGQFQIPQFDFSIGLGEGILPSLNYYGFGDPFLILSALFPAKYSVYVYTVIILLKIYFSGLMFLAYCVHRNCKDYSILIGLPLYICSQYTVCHSVMYPTVFLTATITLPLICMGIDRVLDRKKYSGILIFSVAFTALSGFYVLYMVLLFAGIYALVHILYEKNSIREKIKEGGSLFVQVIWGICMSGVIIVPSVIGYFSSARNTNGNMIPLSELIFPDKQVIWHNISSVTVPFGLTEVGLMLPVFAFALVCIALVKVKKSRPMKCLFILFLCAYVNMKLVSYIMGGFTSAIYYGRWIFCFIFLISFLTVEGMEKLEEVKIYPYAFFSVLYTIFILIIDELYFGNGEAWKKCSICYIVLSMLLIGLYYLVNRWKKWKNKNNVGFIIIGTIIGLIFNVYGVFNICGGIWHLKPYSDIRNELLASSVLKYQTEEPFGRMDIQGTIRNESLYYGYCSANEYLSMINANIVEFYKEYALVPEMYGSVHHLIGLGGRDIIDDLLSVQYTDKPLMEQREEKDTIIKNEDYLPMGVRFDSYISNGQADKLNAVERTAVALETVILDDDTLNNISSDMEKHISDILYDTEYTVSGENVEFDEQMKRIKVSDKSVINISFESEGKGDCYLYAGQWKMTDNDTGTGHVYFNDIYCEFKGAHAMYTHGVDSVSTALGTVEENGIYNCKITFSEEAEYDIKDLHIYVLDSGYVKQMNAQRRKECLQNIKIEPNVISGDMEGEAGSVLFLSIPYSSGWSAFNNESQVDILRADYGFCAIKLNEGMNKIVLRYTTPGLRLGLALTIISMLGMLVWYMIKRFSGLRLSVEKTGDSDVEQ